MSIAQNGNISFQALPAMDEASPAGWLIGETTVVGDATGGTVAITYTFPDSFIYHFDYVSYFCNAGAASNVLYRLATGCGNGNNELIADTDATVLVAGFGNAKAFDLPRMVFRPNQPPVMIIVGTNVNGANHRLCCRALVWDREAFARVPFPAIALSLT